MASDAFDSMIATFKKQRRDRRMRLITAGQSGAGKSTLVKNLLQISDQEGPLAAHSPEAVTTDVKMYHNNVNGILVEVIDTPGLAGVSDEDETKVIAQLNKTSEGNADALLYCVSMNPSAKLGSIDSKIIKLLTKVFKKEVWENTVLILTSADYVKKRNQDNPKNRTVEMLVKRYADTFVRILNKECSGSLVAVPVLEMDKSNRSKQDIPAIPTGETLDEEILPQIKWNQCVFHEVLKKCKFESMKAMLKISEVSSNAMPSVLRGVVGGAVSGAVGGAVVGGLAGAAVGGVGIIPGAIIGAKVGGVSGGVSGGTIGGIAGGIGSYKVADIQFKNSDEGKVARVHQEIERLRRESETTTNTEPLTESKKEK